jgi:hypothetical protein
VSATAPIFYTPRSVYTYVTLNVSSLSVPGESCKRRRTHLNLTGLAYDDVGQNILPTTPQHATPYAWLSIN